MRGGRSFYYIRAIFARGLSEREDTPLLLPCSRRLHFLTMPCLGPFRRGEISRRRKGHGPANTI